MPNTPALVLQGMSALARGQHATAEDGEAARRLFEAVGRTVVLEERLLDAVTGLSGSGPAYVFLAIEALADGGVKAGLPREVAQTLAAQTVAGAAAMVLETGKHPGALKDMVASPGGTTIAGLHALELGGVRAALMSAVEAAARRSRELGAD
jgi:pyrroline-5-carboxylate reductase